MARLFGAQFAWNLKIQTRKRYMLDQEIEEQTGLPLVTKVPLFCEKNLKTGFGNSLSAIVIFSTIFTIAYFKSFEK